MRSLAPPAAYGAMMRIVFDGKGCACAAAAQSARRRAHAILMPPRRAPPRPSSRRCTWSPPPAWHGGGRAVGELARVARGDDTALDRRLDLRHALVGGIGADALVLGGDGLAHRLVARVLVDHLLLHRDRRDLVLELALRTRLRRAL